MGDIHAQQFQWHPITEKPTCDCEVVLYVDRGGQKEVLLAEFWQGFICQRWCDLFRTIDTHTPAKVLAWSLRPDPICPNPETNTPVV